MSEPWEKARSTDTEVHGADRKSKAIRGRSDSDEASCWPLHHLIQSPTLGIVGPESQARSSSDSADPVAESEESAKLVKYFDFLKFDSDSDAAEGVEVEVEGCRLY